jgi:hypothetical protein
MKRIRAHLRAARIPHRVFLDPEEEGAVVIALPGMEESSRLLVEPVTFTRVEEALDPDENHTVTIGGFSVHHQVFGWERGNLVEIVRRPLVREVFPSMMLHAVATTLARWDAEIRIRAITDAADWDREAEHAAIGA